MSVGVVSLETPGKGVGIPANENGELNFGLRERKVGKTDLNMTERNEAY